MVLTRREWCRGVGGCRSKRRAKGLADKVLKFNSSQETLTQLISNRPSRQRDCWYLKEPTSFERRMP